ncbi:Bro-N domain-containing protein [Pseudomonas aeruginosa]
MQTAQIIPFQFDAREVRTMLIDDQPWFVATDVAASLGYRDAFNMCRNLDEDEKDTQIVSTLKEDARGRQILPTLGGEQEMLVINESGLYSAILRSRKAEAKRFKKWVTAEVLPAIRKHGRYEDSANKMATLVGETIGTDGFHMLGALIKGKVAALPVEVRRRATAKIWSQTHAAFGVRSATDIPANQLDAARNFVAAYSVHEGEWLPKGDIKGFGSLIGRPLNKVERWMVFTDHKGEEQYMPIPNDACVMPIREIIRTMVNTPGEIPVSTDEIFEFAQATLLTLKNRSDWQNCQIRQMRMR